MTAWIDGGDIVLCWLLVGREVGVELLGFGARMDVCDVFHSLT